MNHWGIASDIGSLVDASFKLAEASLIIEAFQPIGLHTVLHLLSGVIK